MDTPAGQRLRLRRLINACKLFDIQAWVQQGRPVRFTYARASRKLTALDVAVATGSHAMVEWLLREIERLSREVERHDFKSEPLR
jgi:hypothetical protein